MRVPVVLRVGLVHIGSGVFTRPVTLPFAPFPGLQIEVDAGNRTGNFSVTSVEVSLENAESDKSPEVVMVDLEEYPDNTKPDSEFYEQMLQDLKWMRVG